MNSNIRLRSQRTGWWLVATLAVLTLAGHFVTRAIGAIPTHPSDFGMPATLGTPGVDFTSTASGKVSFTGKLDRQAVLRGGDGQVKMELVLKADEIERQSSARTPTDFVIVLDRSGSMGGSKIEQARTAVRELISQLSTEDRFALVSYSSRAEVSIPLSSATSEARRHWRQVVAGIQPTGGTNMSAGLDLALGVSEGPRPGRAARMILISDGLANEGDATMRGLASRAYRAAASESVVSTVGVGEDFNEFLMSNIADAGTGNYYFLHDTEQLAQVFSAEFEATRETVATAVAVTIAPGDGVRVTDAAGYPLEHAAGRTTFRPGSLFSGQERRIWVTLEVANQTAGDRPLGTFSLAYKDPSTAYGGAIQVIEFSDTPVVACVLDESEYHQSFDRDTWARSVAEEDYNDLQQRVASYVKDGRREEALKEIDDFTAYNQRLNLVMQKKEITRKLEALQSLETEVQEAFEGANQISKQNQLSKTRQYAGREGRRGGSKKAPSTQKGGS